MVYFNNNEGKIVGDNVNATWYLQRLKELAQQKNSNEKNNSIQINNKSNKKLSTQTKPIIPSIISTQRQYKTLKLPTNSIQIQTTKQKSVDNNNSRSRNIGSGVSLRSQLTTNKLNPSRSEFLSNSSETLTTITRKDEKDNFSERRSSICTKSDITYRPSSQLSTDQRCQRAYSSTANSIERETCSILGPQLCSDCIEIQTRANLSPQNLLNKSSIRQRLTALALRRFIKNNQNLTDEDLIDMINNQEIDLNILNLNQLNSTVLTDEEYFDNLSKLLNRYAGESSPYYFKNLNDFAEKYQSNKYKRLLLSQTPIPYSSNPLFQNKHLEKFDVSNHYSYMKRASTNKTNLQLSTSIFVSPRKADPFHLKYKSLNNYSPTLLLQTIRENSKTNLSNQINNNKKRTLIGSKYSHQQTLHL
ncbi:unnamed protein product [Adineta steineri]|uniref:Uncharacterized protein n=1 Tax=Adineta steineri TaxID=433720 RepID=A0A814TJA0_9BILA|nr:unnamed protein product [Adineta steineri]CAF1300546.1 unnamed protein product [Adineta steineri]